MLKFAARAAREAVVHARAAALPVLALAAIDVAAGLAHGPEHGVALNGLPHVRAALGASVALHGARVVCKRPFSALVASRGACFARSGPHAAKNARGLVTAAWDGVGLAGLACAARAAVGGAPVWVVGAGRALFEGHAGASGSNCGAEAADGA